MGAVPWRPKFGARFWVVTPLVVLLSVAGVASGATLLPQPVDEPLASAEAPAPKPTQTPKATVTSTATDAPAPTPEPVTSPTIGPAAFASSSPALTLLATLPVKGKAPMTGYNRTGMFGSAWLDVDRTGCDTRNDMLQRDFVTTVKSGPCKVTNGVLVSPYTGETINFVRGNKTSMAVQIDHVVALADGCAAAEPGAADRVCQ